MNETQARQSSLRAVLPAFLITRLLIFILVLFATGLRVNEPVQQFGDVIQEPMISLGQPGIMQRMGTKVLNADALWYADIARNGYEVRPFDSSGQHNWAFFPLFPLLLRVAGKLTGEHGLTGSVLSSVLFLLGLIQLHKLVLELGHQPQDADRAVLYLAVFPTSYFFSFPFTESLFLFLSVSCFLAATRDSWWLAGLCGALAAATRITGVFLFPVLAIVFWQRYRTINLKALALLLIPLGIVPYMIFLHRITGNALAFMDVQAAWGHSFGFFLRPLWQYVKRPLEINWGWDFRFLNFVAALLALSCSIVLFRKRQWAMAIYCLLCVVVPLSAMRLQSLTRYVMVAFPIFIVLAHAGRSLLVDQIIRSVFLFTLGAMTLLFALHFSMAMS